MVKTIEFKSTNIRSATLGDDGVLDVVFLNNQRARYGGFTLPMMEEWSKAPSGGKWFHENIRSRPTEFPVLPKEPVAVAADAPVIQSVVAAASASATTVATKVDEVACSKEARDLARHLYETYIANADGLNFQGNPCPPWPELTTAVRSHWCSVAKEVERGMESLEIETARVTAELAALTNVAKTIGAQLSTRPMSEMPNVGRARPLRPWRLRAEQIAANPTTTDEPKS